MITTTDLTSHELNTAVAYAENAALRLRRSAQRIDHAGVVLPEHTELRVDMDRARRDLTAASRQLNRAINEADLADD
jgi:hypothetical protein